jgi:hypothetical protein
MDEWSGIPAGSGWLEAIVTRARQTADAPVRAARILSTFRLFISPSFDRVAATASAIVWCRWQQRRLHRTSGKLADELLRACTPQLSLQRGQVFEWSSERQQV